MDKLTDPPMVLGMANSGFLLLVAAYFYKKMEEAVDKSSQLEQAIVALSKKVAELEKYSRQGTENIKKITGEMKTVRKDVKTASKLTDKINEVSYDMNTVIDELNNQGFDISTQTSHRETRTPRAPKNTKPSKSKDDFAALIDAVTKSK